MEWKLHHISYAVRSTEDAIKAFASLYPVVKTRRVLEPSQRVYVSYLAQSEAGPYIELVEPAESESPVHNLLAAHPSAMYHLCYAVDDFDKAVEEMKTSGFFMVSKPFESQVDAGQWASHFFHPQAGIIEIMGPRHE
jgi:methylmalonyl-CoA/ethylmalonyl-CoA epimerase